MLGLSTILFLIILYSVARGGDDPSGPWPGIF